MTYNTILLVFGLVTSLAQAIGNSIDSSTYANIEEVHSTHLFFNFEVDFDTESFKGSVEHTMTVKDENATSIFFDAAGLEVSKVWVMLNTTNGTYMEANFSSSTPNPNLGQAIDVSIPTVENFTLMAD